MGFHAFDPSRYSDLFGDLFALPSEIAMDVVLAASKPMNRRNRLLLQQNYLFFSCIELYFYNKIILSSNLVTKWAYRCTFA